ncbi:MAG TPA: hypothetical protein VGG15_00930 [Terriglobales bacterium]|jgi:hypothetical protein
MLKENVLTEESQAVPEISPEYLAKLKKEDMKEAVVERFRSSSETPAVRTAMRRGDRSPQWHSADEEC